MSYVIYATCTYHYSYNVNLNMISIEEHDYYTSAGSEEGV